YLPPFYVVSSVQPIIANFHVLGQRLSVIFFFFQAEDGIRDRNVTGVQTCALPIYPFRGAVRAAGGCVCTASCQRPLAACLSGTRAEERRVGGGKGYMSSG